MIILLLLLAVWVLPPLAFYLGALMAHDRCFRAGWSAGYRAGLEDGEAIERKAIASAVNEAHTHVRLNRHVAAVGNN